jgi:intracellular multiplication protein IcmL
MVISVSSDPQQDVSNYRDAYKNLFRFVTLMWLVILVLTAGLFYCVTSVHKQDRFYAANMQGGLNRLVPLYDPNVNNQAILSWASQASVDILTFGFNDIGQRFAETRKNFTPEGWESFRDAAIRSGVMERVSNLRQIITAIPTGSPEMLYYGLIENKIGWIVRVPVVVTVRAGDQKNSSYLNVIMTIVKMPSFENPRAIGIDKWVSN